MTKTELISAVADKADFTFEVRDRKAKQVINPQTKKMMTAPASKAPAFKAGQALKNAVNK